MSSMISFFKHSMWHHKPDASSSNLQKTELELIKNYNDFLHDLEFEHWIHFAHDIRKMHFDFFMKCLRYDWGLHSMYAYLASNSYHIVYNLWMLNFSEVVENEKEEIARGKLLIWFYFSKNKDILRFIIWKREILISKIFNKVKEAVPNINKWICH